MSHAPRTEHDICRDPLWRDDNTEGDSTAQLAALNSEFAARWIAGDWPGAETVDAAAKWFADEVGHRP